MATLGKVYLVGAGPGDPELLTLKALRLVSEADVLVYDHLVAPELLSHARADCERLFAGKKGGQFCKPQDQIETLLVRLALEGKTVVRLKGGDPFIFGRGGEEAEALAAAAIPFEIVPGVTAALAAAAYSGIPLTHRAHASAVVFLTGHGEPGKPQGAVHWEDYARLGATLCIYMGVRNLSEITRRLIGGGMAAATPAAIVQAATTTEHRQLVATVGNLAQAAAEADFQAPALVVVGEVATFSERLSWFDAAHRASSKGTFESPARAIHHLGALR